MPAENTTDAAATIGGGQFTGGPPAPSDPLVRGGDVVLASTLITNDSDTPGPVVAEIRSGPQTDTGLLGGFDNNLGNTHSVAQCNVILLPDGMEVLVSAYAVDAR